MENPTWGYSWDLFWLYPWPLVTCRGKRIEVPEILSVLRLFRGLFLPILEPPEPAKAKRKKSPHVLTGEPYLRFFLRPLLTESRPLGTWRGQRIEVPKIPSIVSNLSEVVLWPLFRFQKLLSLLSDKAKRKKSPHVLKGQCHEIIDLPNAIIRGLGEDDSRKKPEEKVSWHCPFKCRTYLRLFLRPIFTESSASQDLLRPDNRSPQNSICCVKCIWGCPVASIYRFQGLMTLPSPRERSPLTSKIENPTWGYSWGLFWLNPRPLGSCRGQAGGGRVQPRSRDAHNILHFLHDYTFSAKKPLFGTFWWGPGFADL